jgi:hypothetical protein
MIYVNGDSWTSGWPDEETHGHRNFSWPHLLSLKTGNIVINDARAASSNYRIYRRSFDYILSNAPDIAVIFFTSWIRLESGNAESGKIYQYIPVRDPAFFKNDWSPYLAYTTFLRQIISLQLASKSVGTKLYMLDTFSDNLIKHPTKEWFITILKDTGMFDKFDDERIEKKFNKILALNQLIDYNMFISESSYQTLINGCMLKQNHPIKDGHESIATIVYNAISK